MASAWLRPEPFPPGPREPSASAVRRVPSRGQHGLASQPCPRPLDGRTPDAPPTAPAPLGASLLRTSPRVLTTLPELQGTVPSVTERLWGPGRGSDEPKATQVTKGNSESNPARLRSRCSHPPASCPGYFPRCPQSPGPSATHGHSGWITTRNRNNSNHHRSSSSSHSLSVTGGQANPDPRTRANSLSLQNNSVKELPILSPI